MTLFLNQETEAFLTQEGFVPGDLGHLWVGDMFMWQIIGHKDRDPHTFVALDVEVVSVQHDNTIIRVVAMGRDGAFTSFTASVQNETWIKQCNRNKRELFDLGAVYRAQALRSEFI